MFSFCVKNINYELENKYPALNYTEKFFDYTFTLRVWSEEEDILDNMLEK